MIISYISGLVLNFLCGFLRCGPAYNQSSNQIINTNHLNNQNLVPVQSNLKVVRNRWIHPDTFLKVPEIIARNGYPIEVHEVYAADGFINTVHRIPKPNGPAVYLLHGNFQSSADFLLNGVNGSLAFVLSNEGYDVYLGNFRGNEYSNKHVNLTRKNRKYWDYSFDEMALYDYPAVINYILDLKHRETPGLNDQKLHYIGFSMGTTVYYCAMALHPELNEKIKLSISLGPAAYAHNWRSPIRFAVHTLRLQEAFTSIIGDNIVRPDFWFNLLHQVAPFFCTPLAFESNICRNIIFFIAGFDQDELHPKSLALVTGHTPSPVSTKNVIHVLQIMKSKKFARYDYKRRKNMQIYGQATPPLYDLSKITAPSALIYGNNDWVADPEDVALLAAQLPNCVYYKPVDYKYFNHIDFVFAKRAKELVYDTCLDLMKTYNH